jgi:hypothetical protein
MKQLDFEKIIGSIPERRYWMFRTMGGVFYREFAEDGFIAIGYNEITLDELKALPENEVLSIRMLSAYTEDRISEYKKAPYYPAYQLLRFYREMKVGDVVVIPGYDSQIMSFGVISGKPYEDDTKMYKDDFCQFKKRRMVEWKKTSSRDRLNPKLQLMFNSRHVVSNIDQYAPYVDSIMRDFYIKDDSLHLVLRINTDENIKAEQFFSLYRIFNIIDGYCRKFHLDASTKDIVMKIQMESPGDIRLSSKNKLIMFFVGVSFVFICGGGFKISFGNFNLNLSTPGVLEHFQNHLDRRVDREIKMSIKNQMDSLKIESPKDLEAVIQLLHEQNSIRNSY